MTALSALDRGRVAFGRRAWADAFALLSTADAQDPLARADLDLLVTAAYLVGRDDTADDLAARAYREWHPVDPPRAAHRACWLGFQLLLRGEVARGGGWLARAERLLDEGGHDCAARGYLLVVESMHQLAGGDSATSYDSSVRAARLGERFGDPDLIALGQLCAAEALDAQEKIAAGMALLDEAMVAVTAGEVSPIASGILFCAALEEYQKVFDLRRAQEWTAALTRWCDAQPDLVPYRGQCLVHRAELMRLRGDWSEAMGEAGRAVELLSRPPVHPAVGAAFYQRGELHRLAGEFDRSEEAYQRADRWGHSPQPGFALLRLAQGRTGAAAGLIRRAVEETGGRVARARLLAAHVEIMLAAGEVAAARDSADELSKIADHFQTPLLRATAAQARGAVLVDEGDGRAACPVLRTAWTCWQELDAGYDAARTRVLVALALRRLGDEDGAEAELDAARWVFQQLGAGPDLSRVDALSRRSRESAAPRPSRGATAPGRLTTREIEVLRWVAAGNTNRAIAARLHLSEKTVARHISNIFGKLGLSSRAAATAYAYQHDLV